MKKIIDMDFLDSIDTGNPKNLSDFDRYNQLPRRQCYEALCSLVVVIQRLGLQEKADQFRKTDFNLGAWDLALNTALGNKLMIELEDGSKEDAFHDYWMSCEECGEEIENEDACSIEEDGVETWVCPECFCASLTGEEE